MGKMITTVEAAAKTGKTPGYIRRLCRENFFQKKEKRGRDWFVDEDELPRLNEIQRGRPPKSEGE